MLDSNTPLAAAFPREDIDVGTKTREPLLSRASGETRNDRLAVPALATGPRQHPTEACRRRTSNGPSDGSWMAPPSAGKWVLDTNWGQMDLDFVFSGSFAAQTEREHSE